MTKNLAKFSESKIAAVCTKIQNGGQNDTFWPNENMTLYTNSYCDLSVYFDVFGYKEYISIIFQIQHGRQVQEIQIGCQNDV